jgi:flagellar biosynthetic protein FliR
VFEVYRFNEKEILLFALMLVRISACFVTMPLFGSKDVPHSIKVLLSLVTTFILFTSQRMVLTKIDFQTDDLITLAAREAFIGVFIGYLTRGIFWGVQVAGQILGFSLGFSAAQIFNPAFGDSGTVIEQLQSNLALLLFFSINGHHWMIEALAKSFQLAPMAQIGLHTEPLVGISHYITMIFAIGVKLAAPMMAVVVFLNFALGVVGRAVPQINVFVISFPINITVGLLVFMVTIPLLLAVMETDFSKLTVEVFKFIKAF